MSRNGSGTYSLPAGNPVTGGTTITSTWANNTLSDIASALTQSLSIDGQTTMTGTLPMGGNSISNALNITCTATLNAGGVNVTAVTVVQNGLYLPSANTLGFAVNTTAIGSATTAGLVWTVPSTAKSYTVTDSTVPANGMYLPAANTLGFASNTLLRFKFDANGALTMNAPTSGVHTINVASGTNGLTITDGTRSIAQYTNATDTYFGSVSNHPVNFISNGSLRATIAAGGGWTFSAPTTTSLPAGIFHGGAATTPIAVTFAATGGTLNCALSNVFTTTLTANITSAYTLSNPTDGQTINWFLTQDGTGSRTMTWPASFKWPGGAAGVLTTSASAVDLLVATYRASTGFWYASLSKGFA